MIYRTAWIAAAAAWLAAGSAIAGAFGIEMGTPLSRLKGAELFNDSSPVKTYYVTVPQPNSEFDRYIVEMTEETGVCSIIGFGRLYDNDSYGKTVLPPYQRLKTALTTKYGPPISDESALYPGALWNKEGDFAASIYRKERKVAVGWNLKDRPGDIGTITMIISADSTSTTSVVISYGFKNEEKCEQMAEQSDNSGL